MTTTLKTSKNYDAWRIQPLTNLASLSWVEAIEHILGWGLLAPSAHNIQPWHVELNQKQRTINIMPRKKFIGAPSDKTGRESHISVGCFGYNVCLALESYGIKAKYKIEINKNMGKFIITLPSKLNTSQVSAKNFDLMLKRRAYRGRFKERHPIPDALAKSFKKIVDKNDGRLDLISDPTSKTIFAELQELADRAVLIIPEFRYELAEVMRPSDTLEERVMPADTFILPSKVEEELEVALKSKGKFPGSFADAFARDDFQRTVEASAMGVITMPTDTPEHWIKAGMTFEELWLKANDNNFEISVMAAMVESGVENRALKIRLGQIQGKCRPTVVFRIGAPLEEVPHSPRLVSIKQLFEVNS